MPSEIEITPILVAAIPAAAIFALFLVRIFVYPLRIVSNSMFPTIRSGDLRLARKKMNKKYQRGDVLVFHAQEYNKDFVKRLIGLPGDKIEIKNGDVFINGNLLNEPYVINNCVYRGSFKVPAGSYFFLGDNRDASTDSRSFDNPYVAAEDIKGKLI